MNLNEAIKTLKNNGYIVEGSMSLPDKIDNARKQTSKIKLTELEDLLKDQPKLIECKLEEEDLYYVLYFKTTFNEFEVLWDDNNNKYDLYYNLEEGWSLDFTSAERIIRFLFEDGYAEHGGPR